RAFGKVKVDANKVKWILNDLYDNIELPFDQRLQVMKAVSLCKAQLVEDAEGIDKLVDAYSLDVPTESAERNSFIRKVLNVLERSRKDTARVDFDDMIWMPVVLGLKLNRYDRVFIDETQDLNAAQIELALGACKDGGRICAVGDDRQAIYAFRGADSQAIPNIVARLQAKELYLSVTYRCALSIVKQAQNYVPDLQAASNAAEGVVTFADNDHMMREVRPGDFILSRTNAPLVRTCLQLIRERRPATIQGRDIGAGLIALIKKS